MKCRVCVCEIVCVCVIRVFQQCPLVQDVDSLQICTMHKNLSSYILDIEEAQARASMRTWCLHAEHLQEQVEGGLTAITRPGAKRGGIYLSVCV